MRKSWRYGLVLGLLLALAVAPLHSQPFNTQLQIAINNLITGVTTFTRMRLIPAGYINWGSGTDAAGYGLRSNGGTLEFKNSGGSWTAIGTGGGGGAPTDASYWVRTANGTLSNETVMGALGTGLVKNTTVTGVPSIAVVADILSLFTGTCNNSTILYGDGTCAASPGGAPSTASYITQVPEAGLSAEQALSLLSTGIVKVTTSTGVLSNAALADVLALFTGTCNNTTIIYGDGSCAAAPGGAPSTASYLTRTAESGLSNEQALGLLATGILKVTTTTGVVSVAASSDVIALFTGSCDNTTMLAGNGACVVVSPTTATYVTNTPNASLSNEQALSLLATGLVKVTTTTGVLSAAASADVIALFTGTCNSTTVLAGNGTCVTPGSGAPVNATYITQTANATLTAEQPLSLLTTGLMKVTTGTGVVSTAGVNDVIGLFTGTCNGTTVLAGNGTCIAVSGGGAPSTATYLTQTPDAGLSAEQAMSLLATGLMKVTTGTGVVSAASVNDIIGYFTGTCNASTVLAGNGTCVTPASGGAPTNATYITQTANATLTNEQALSSLATGLMKVTTTTGVISAANVNDILGYFTGTCNSSTVLTGAGTCAALSTAFSIITSGTATSAAMVVGTGSTLTATGTGTITSTQQTSVGTVPGISGCGAGTQTGGAEAGTFTSTTTGACTVVLTFARTAPTGWACAPQNRTTANLIRQSASSTTSCTVTGTTVSGDVVSFSAVAY